MHTQETEREAPGLGTTAKSVAERASALVRLELELATLELKRKASSLAINRCPSAFGSERATGSTELQ